MNKAKNLKAVLKNAIHKGKDKDKGFSLAEITVGLAVLGLATVALVGWQVNEYRHAKAREIATTLQAIDAGLYQVQSLVGYIPVNRIESPTTSPNSDTIYGCILRNTDSWKGLVSGGGGDDLVAKYGGIRLGNNKLWFPSEHHAYAYYKELVNNDRGNVLVQAGTSNLYNIPGANVGWAYSAFVLPPLFVVSKEPQIYCYKDCDWVCRRNNWDDVCNWEWVCRDVCSTYHPAYFSNIGSWFGGIGIRSVRGDSIMDDCGTFRYGHITIWGESGDWDLGGGGVPAFLYVKCNNNPPPQNISTPSNPNAPNNSFNPASLIPQNLLDPRIDLRKLAEQGYRIRFNTSGNRLVSLTLFKPDPEGITPEEGRALQAMISGSYNPNSRTFTYTLNKGNGYRVQAVNNFNCQ